jgi:molybdate transport system substrate-binding protein
MVLRAAILLLAMAAPVQATELKVVAAGAVRGVLGGMIDDHSRRSGVRFDLTVGPTGVLREALKSGNADLVITSAPLMAELERSKQVVPDSRVDLGRVGLGVVVRAGTPLPDISTPEAIRAALLKAKTIAYTDPKLGGTSVEHLMKFTEAMGIKDQVIQKAVTATGGNDAAAKVAEGQAEISVVPISDIHHKDARLVGPLPEPIQLWTVYAAAIPVASRDPAAARAFVEALTAPEMRERWLKAGMQPAK